MTAFVCKFMSLESIVGDELFKAVGDWDIGDIIGCVWYGVSYPHRRVDRPNASQLRILVKSLLPLPDKFHGVAG